jgi:multidrug efflux pump subunit AcrA (membrane-fusion protein)
MFRKRIFWVVLLVAVAAGLGGYAFYRLAYLPRKTSSEPSLQTAVVRRGDLILRASSAGTVIPAIELDIGFKGSGLLIELLVGVGDQVEAGQLLARLDDAEARYQLAQAEQTLRELTSPLVVATARQSVANSQEALDEALGNLAYLISPEVLEWEQAVAEAERGLAAAEAAAAAADASSAAAAELAVEEAAASLEAAQAGLAESQRKYEVYYVPYAFTESYYSRALGRQVEYIDAPSDLEIAQARAEADIAVARLQEAQYLYAALTDAELPGEAWGSDLTKLQQARTSVETAQTNLDATGLYAPIDATVTSINATVGEQIGSGNIITLADLSRPMLEIFLDETDLNMIAVGYEAEVVLDAYPDVMFRGHVVQVDPELVTVQGVSTVRGLVVLNEASVAGYVPLPSGLSAAVDVISGRAEQALLVPVEALQELSPGEYAVFVMVDGDPRLQMVEVGLMDFTYAEITSGLEQGDVVTTGVVETQ